MNKLGYGLRATGYGQNGGGIGGNRYMILVIRISAELADVRCTLLDRFFDRSP